MASFPLLQVPDDAVIKRVLQNMGPVELVASSLEKFKKSRGQSENTSGSHQDDCFSLRRLPVILGKTQGNQLYHPFEVENKPLGFKYEKFKVQDWVKHLQYIFHHDEIDQLSMYVSKFDVNSVWEAFKTEDISFSNRVPREYIEIVLRAFRTVKRIKIDAASLQDFEKHMSLSISNFDSVKVTYIDFPLKLTLDMLLSVNSKEFHVMTVKVADRDLNKFLKLWKTGSNPRIEMLHVTGDNEPWNREVILKGLNSKKEVWLFSERMERKQSFS